MLMSFEPTHERTLTIVIGHPIACTKVSCVYRVPFSVHHDNGGSAFGVATFDCVGREFELLAFELGSAAPHAVRSMTREAVCAAAWGCVLGRALGYG